VICDTTGHFQKVLIFYAPTANFTLFFMAMVSALPLGAAHNLLFAEGENKNVQEYGDL
jgi:hypothetical protein